MIFTAFVYYVTLEFRLAITMLAFSLLCDATARSLQDFRIAIAGFVVGWILQGIGHAVFEKRSLAFAKNLVHLLIGPIFLLNEALGVRKASISKNI